MVNQIITIKKTRGIKTVSARELHERLQVTDRFNRWFDSMLKYGFEENKDFCYVKSSTQQNQYGGTKEIDDYAISLDMAKEICMIQRSEIGKAIRKYFIELEKRYNEQSSKQYKEIRSKSKEIRKEFTDILKSHECTKPYHYINITNGMKKIANIDLSVKKNDMTKYELRKISACESLASAMLEEERGYYEVKPVCIEASTIVTNVLEERKKKLLA